ncbi:MAG: DUF3320 domain-containing protein [Sphaerochaetaceae bacterium]|nr:DUF3320 domain-containing protein [Sphaerochaetaceae bacterium]
MDMKRMNYTETVLETVPITPEQFIGGELDDDIRARIETIVDAEGPVMQAVLAKRLINSYGMQQLGRRLREKFEALLAGMNFPTTTQAEGTVYWQRDAGSRSGRYAFGYTGYRYCDEDCKRYSYQIPVCEVVYALVDALEQCDMRFIPKNALFAKAAQLLGYQRKGASVRAILDEALNEGLATGMLIRSGNGRIALPSE